MHVRVSGSSRHGAPGWINLLLKQRILALRQVLRAMASGIVTGLGVAFVFLDATSVTAGGESADPILVNDVP
jgi:hypothetical protein